jgi:hypothetical protein
MECSPFLQKICDQHYFSKLQNRNSFDVLNENGLVCVKSCKKNHFFLHLQKNESIFLEGVNYLKEKPLFPNLEMIEAESKPAHVSKRRTESRYF